MKIASFNFLFALVFAVACTATSAQTGETANPKLLAEITDFRQKLNHAIAKRDRETLETMFADDFTHTHAIGKVDGKQRRIEAITGGDVTLESVKPEEIAVRFYGKQTAIAVGQTTIDQTVYRWTILYVKNKKSWRIAASQASVKQ